MRVPSHPSRSPNPPPAHPHPALRLRWLAGSWLLAAFFLLIPHAQSAVSLPFYDGFDYAESTTLGASGSGSEAVWDRGNSPGITSPFVTAPAALDYPGLPSGTGLGVLLDSPESSSKERGVDTETFAMTGAGETVYASLLINIVAYPVESSGLVYFDDNASPSGSMQGVGLLSDGRLTLHRNAAITSPGGTTTTALGLNTTYLLVFRYKSVAGGGNDELALWINPALGEPSETTPDLTITTGGSDRSNLDGFFFKQDTSFTAAVYADELRLGTSWTDVTPSSGTCVTAGITSEPVSAAVESGTATNFTIIATGTSPTFQWEVSTDGGGTWAPVSSGTGADSANYSTDVVTTAENGHQYRAIVNVACDSSSITSAVATLTVSCDSANISSGPLQQDVEAGQTANFSISAAGSGAVYQWEVSADGGANWNPVSSGTGGNSTSYTTASTTTAENGYQYRAIVNVACDSSSVTSAVATLTVSCSTVGILQHPANTSVFAGNAAAFSVSASGSSPTYQWEVSTDAGQTWNPVTTGSGANASTYTTAPISVSENGYQYRATVSVACDFSVISSSSAQVTIADPASASFRSVVSGNWEDVSTWELSTDGGTTWNPAFAAPTAANSTNILIKDGTTVTLTANRTVDELVVEAGATLTAGANLTIANAAGVDLDVSGTVIATAGSSAITLQVDTEFNVRSGGVFVHAGSSSSCVNNGGGILTVESGGKFILQRAGGTIPTAAWNSGSTCEVNYSTASTSRPNGNSHGQPFHHFHWNNINQNSGNDLANVLTNIAGNLTVDAGSPGSLLEFKLNNSSGNANGFYGGDIIVNAGRFNWASGGGPYVWTLRGDLVIKESTAMDVSGSAGGSYTLLLDSGTVQNYTCEGDNLAVKLNWTVTSGTTLNLNDSLPATAPGRTVTADGIVNLNGNTLATDLLAGSGTVRNQGGGNGLLVVGAGNSDVSLDGTVALLDGASGNLGLGKAGSGTLSIAAAQTFSGGLVVSNGTVLVNNAAGSGTGAGAVVVHGGTLGGDGTIAGLVTVEAEGALSPGTAIGDMTINNTVTLTGNTVIELDKGSAMHDRVIANAANYGGTLTVTDIGGGLSVGDAFVIFNVTGAKTGNFASITPEPGPGMTWQFNPATGTLSVAGPSVEQPTLHVSQANGILTFSWLESGFKLQSQTNAVGAGLGTNWFDVLDGANSPIDIGIDAAGGSVFFRLVPQ